MTVIRWKCHICGDVRPDPKISVVSYDLSPKYKLPHGTMMMNTRYCNDRPSCEKEAKRRKDLSDEA